ncbi:DUF1998 domain-containing protein [Nocardia tengchongensis]|uniref:DUF1998 domain-containing protein n=1 Tax=Nocardia tengchongensis TaxID=2055889 RepID=A0ABX8CY69_9NOCA|nr:DUF1998 domain-containing protein [Nocardia tengchongensis]
MPDQDTGRRRRFLVLHDTLPGGTGYLHRLASSDNFRDVLTAARGVVANCPCQEELPPRAACHRCLLSHIPNDKSEWYDKVSRLDALEMLNELLEDWAVGEVSDTTRSHCGDQVESELEARFLDGLTKWANRTDTEGTLARGELVAGKRTADLRIEGPAGRCSIGRCCCRTPFAALVPTWCSGWSAISRRRSRSTWTATSSTLRPLTTGWPTTRASGPGCEHTAGWSSRSPGTTSMIGSYEVSARTPRRSRWSRRIRAMRRILRAPSINAPAATPTSWSRPCGPTRWTPCSPT